MLQKRSIAVCKEFRGQVVNILRVAVDASERNSIPITVVMFLLIVCLPMLHRKFRDFFPETDNIKQEGKFQVFDNCHGKDEERLNENSGKAKVNQMQLVPDDACDGD